MRWRLPFNKSRETRTYTEARDELAYLQAAGHQVATIETTGLYNAIGGLYARAFATADVEGAAIDSTLLGSIGRALVLDGSVVLDLGDDGMTFAVPDSWLVTGGHQPASWRYKMQFVGPSAQATTTRTGAGVAHLTYETHPARPWQGISPLRKAVATGKAYAELEQHFVAEAGMSHGVLMVMPVAQAELKSLNKEVSGTKGKLAMLAANQHVPTQGLPPQRYGSDPPETLIELWRSLGRELCASAGVHPGLLGWNDFASGVDTRETWRHFLAGTIRPLGDRIEAELSAKLEREVRLVWQTILESDIGARARAAGTLVRDCKLPPAEALAKVGML